MGFGIKIKINFVKSSIWNEHAVDQEIMKTLSHEIVLMISEY
jgi:hypothetical protein